MTVEPGVPWYLLSLLRSTIAGAAAAVAARPARASPAVKVFMIARYVDSGGNARRLLWREEREKPAAN